MNNRLNLRTLIRFLAAVAFIDGLLFSGAAHATRARSVRLNCPASKLSGTVYNLPVEGKTPNFWSLVHLNGTGLLRSGKLIHAGRILHRPSNCSTTRTSSSGECLLSYFGVAADLRYYRPGDIIYVPSLKGKLVRLPSGKLILHPGYFIVQDTGGAIKGRNRFDFFIGTDTDNTSSFKGTGIGDKRFCGNEFQVIHRNPRRPNPQYLAAYEAIYAATDSTRQNVGSMLASIPIPVPRPQVAGVAMSEAAR